VDGDNVGVVQFRSSLSLAFESSPAVGVLTQVKTEKLKCDFPIEFGVFGKVNFPHATGTNALDDAVIPDYAAVCELNMRSGYIV
jgi:hypothetical protein